ncbi:hypothetical protein H7J88_16760 [Mycolicibacterium flavescens]|uniref:acyl-CoA dehydrogenase family protein n=1 Tax=Mycolicibacterium flavescens TaxID=1776 RepID=UPI000A012282|nr:acyl-CoA dehydrogenase family protein [Mycolicibacterium flavescens]MCV7281293.1 hypothetical protein [Mycolicibacterium flavescens]
MRFSGRWSYASGSPHADWAAVGVTVEADTAPAEQYFALVPRTDLVLDENWRTVGMRGTGSHTWVAEDVFVPEHRLLPLSAVIGAEPPLSEPIYRLPVGAFSTVVILGPLLGLAKAALEHTVAKAATKGIHHTVYTRQSESVGVQVQIAEAALKVDTARMHAYRIADEMDAATTARQPVDYADRARMRAAAGYASRQILDSIQMLLDVHGAGSFAEAHPLQRFWRDANVMARHAGLNAAVGYEVFGKSLLGVAEQISPVV